MSGLSGLTKAYRSELSTTGSFETSGASRCDDMPYLPSVAMTSRAASPGSCKMNSSLPEKTAISPVAALRRWAMIGALGSFVLPTTDGAGRFFEGAPFVTLVIAPAIWPGIRTAAPAAAATAPDRAIKALLLIGSTHPLLFPRLARQLQ